MYNAGDSMSDGSNAQGFTSVGTYRGRGGRGGRGRPSRGGRGGLGRGAPYSLPTQHTQSYESGGDISMMSDGSTGGDGSGGAGGFRHTPYSTRGKRGGRGGRGGFVGATTGGGDMAMSDAAGAAGPAGAQPRIQMPNTSILTYIVNQNVQETGFVSFANLANSPLAHEFSIPIDLNDQNFVRNFFGCFYKRYRNIITKLDLSGNGIVSLIPFGVLGNFFPRLTHLSFENNGISSIEDLDCIKNLHFLKEINLVGNPVSASAANKGEYIGQLQQKFPRLEIVDKQPVAQQNVIAFPVAKKEIKLPDINARSFFDEKSTFDIVVKFVNSYFTLFDAASKEQRDKLLSVYGQNCRFSYTVSTQSTSSGFVEAREDLQNMIGNSRNLTRQLDANRREQMLCKGRIATINSLTQNVPRTKHNVPEFLCDAYMMALGQHQVIVVTLHGEFQGEKIGLLRSFDRCFILDAATEEARAAGWDVVILNDELHIRPHTKFDMKLFTKEGQPGLKQYMDQMLHQAKTPSPSAAGGVPAAAAAVAQPAGATGSPSPDQATIQAMVTQLSQQTGMNSQFSYKCLQDLGWNFNAALQAFQANKNNLPPQAFVQ